MGSESSKAKVSIPQDISSEKKSLLDQNLSRKNMEDNSTCQFSVLPEKKLQYQTREATKEDVPSIARMIQVFFEETVLFSFAFSELIFTRKLYNFSLSMRQRGEIVCLKNFSNFKIIYFSFYR